MQKVPSSLYFRHYHKSDRAELIRGCYAEQLPPHLYPYLEETYPAPFNKKSHAAHHTIGIISSRIVASGFLFRTPAYTEIADLFVSPSYRNQGIGSALIWHLKALADRERWFPLELTVDRENRQAHALYTRLGFVEKSQFELQDRQVILMRYQE